MSGGGSKDTTVTQTNQMSPLFMPAALGLLTKAQETWNQPYKPYGGQLVADQPQATQDYQSLTAQRAIQGSPTEQAAGQEATKTLQGQYLGYSPGVNQYIGARTPVGLNPYIGSTTGLRANQYAGQNPYIENQIRAAQGDVRQEFALGTAAQTDAAASRARALGGSAYNELSGIQSGQLVKRLGDISSGMRFQDYQTQQAMEEAALGRETSTQLADYARNAGLMESGIGLRASLAQGDIGRNAGLVESGLGRQQQGFQTERENQMRALGLSPGIQAMDYTNLAQLGAVGQQQQAYQQRVLDSAYQQWQQEQQYPYSQAQFGAGILGPLAGTTTQQTSPYTGTNSATSSLGGAALGYGATSALGSAFGGALATPYAPWLGAFIGGLGGYFGSR